MKFVVDISDNMAREIDKFASARQRKRAAWVRAAIQRALLEEYERITAESYRRHPQGTSDEHFDPEEWEKIPPGTWDPPQPKSRTKKSRSRR